jgi:putative transposase
MGEGAKRALGGEKAPIRDRFPPGKPFPKRALERLHRELMELNPSAARSLEEGMEETLTVHRLRVPSQLRRTLASTNVIESAFSIVETVCRNVKRWRAGDHIERWVGSGLLVAERQFRKVQGYRDIPRC